jgi:hypothetical protein
MQQRLEWKNRPGSCRFSRILLTILLKKRKELEAGLFNKRLMLSLSFRCDQIYMYEVCDFGHTLLRYLSRT